MSSPPHKMSKISSSLSSQSGLTSAPVSDVSASLPPLSKTTPTPRKRLGLTSGVDQSGVRKLTLKPKVASSPALASSFSSRSSPTYSSSSAKKVRTPLEYANEATITLTRAVRAIQSRPPQPTPESLQSLYSLCEACVSYGPSSSQQLYDGIRIEIERASTQARQVLDSAVVQSESTEAWAQLVDEEWNGWDDRMLLIRSIFLHLDRTYALQTPGLLSIWDLSQDIFRQSVIEHETIAPRLTSTLLDLIEKERNGGAIPNLLLKSLLTRLRTLSSHSHTTIFTTPFLYASREYYKKEGETKFQLLEHVPYLALVERRLEEESRRCDTVLGADIEKSMKKVVLDELVTGYVEKIGESGLKPMMKDDQRNPIRTLFVLLSCIDSLTCLRNSLYEYVKDTGLEIVMDTDNDATMIPNLIDFRSRTMNIVNDTFGRDPNFIDAVGKAFEFFINKRENKPAEMMAKYLDAKLRARPRALGDEEVEQALQDVLYLFRFTQGKDIFEAFYKRDLAKRLLLNKSASFDAERSMLNKLKDECGPGFTAKLEIMFRDMELSADVMKSYTTSPSYIASKPSFDLSVAILSQGNWPTYDPMPVRLPVTLSKDLDQFASFYVAKHGGRNLSWRHQLDTVSLKAVFPKGGKKELSVSLYQACVLLLFNDVPEGGQLSFEEIVQATSLELKEARRTLQSLACGKVRVLQKVPRGRDVNEGDLFHFNTEFKDDHVKIRINQIQQRETAEENKSTTERVFTDRSSHLQLAIVRIMKARKSLKYQELVMEVVSQIGTRFKVQTTEIKKAIDSLITLEYLQRAADQPGVFEYLA